MNMKHKASMVVALTMAATLFLSVYIRDYFRLHTLYPGTLLFQDLLVVFIIMSVGSVLGGLVLGSLLFCFCFLVKRVDSEDRKDRFNLLVVWGIKIASVLLYAALMYAVWKS